MYELTPENVFEGLLSAGMFCDKLPPILSSKSFFDHRFKKQGLPKDGWNGWITFRYLRNNGQFREFGIPNPFSYERLARHIANHWNEICEILAHNTEGQPYCISRIHPRKISDSKAIFKMNYKNWRTDSNPIPTIFIGQRYLVKCDISKCFPSIYTHAIDWAIEGRKEAKLNKLNNKETWGTKLDKLAANTRNGETHGLLVGPHASNILSELILTAIDKKLFDQGFLFLRNIDDYECYVDSYQKAELFIICLERYLSEYRLSLNQKKTEIIQLPITVSEHWVRSIKNYPFTENTITYKEAQSFLDHSIEVMKENDNTSVLLYAFHVLANKNMNSLANKYYMDIGSHLACLYPYLTPHIDKTLFQATHMPKIRIKELSEILYRRAMVTRDYLTAAYSVYFALRYNFQLDELDETEILDSDDCLLKLFSFLYAKAHSSKQLRDSLRDNAKSLSSKEDFDRNWLFAYHSLPVQDLPEGDWRSIKKLGLSFLI